MVSAPRPSPTSRWFHSIGWVKGTFLLGAVGVLIAQSGACATGSPIGVGGKGQGDGGKGSAGVGGQVTQACLLHDCKSDAECGTCSDGRNSCDVPTQRCVACDPNSGTGCPDGLVCSSYGTCAPAGQTCATDSHGKPQITCQKSADCAACDPLHQVCDNVTSACVACTPGDTSSCNATDICVNDNCEAKCPSSCSSDNDCSLCGTDAAPAHACNGHECAACSDTYACPSGLTCTRNGTCEKVCGSDGDGTCTSDDQCNGCGGGNTTCHKPINGGNGKCGISAAGCSQLGNIALPAPWNEVTNTCSKDADCSGAGIELNVGKLLRDATGFNDIGDANLEYGMNRCASIGINANINCGLCVPCEVDADCKSIPIDGLSGEMFGAIGQVAADVILDEIFGDSDHQVHMYCQNVAGNYGVCAPCPGVLYACGGDNGSSSSSSSGAGGASSGDGGAGSSSGSSSGSSGTPSCDHDECTQGGPLEESCSNCSFELCQNDDYCCTTAWDSTCVGEVADACGDICDGSSSTTSSSTGSGGGSCDHDECVTGDALDPSCDSCVEAICEADDFCCNNTWDSTCVGDVEVNCGFSC